MAQFFTIHVSVGYKIKHKVGILGAGRRTRLALWDDPADDVTGVIARSEKVAGTFQKVRAGYYYSMIHILDYTTRITLT